MEESEYEPQNISIHALLAESDGFSYFYIIKITDFYPRSPCGERLHKLCELDRDNRNFYPRSPCGERQSTPAKPFSTSDFYPRSPCGERLKNSPALLGNSQFLSTLSLRRATTISIVLSMPQIFLSTLSLRRATDCPGRAHKACEYFYPRSPCGERLHLFAPSGVDFIISIHALLAESDSSVRVSLSGSTISIHALLAESD